MKVVIWIIVGLALYLIIDSVLDWFMNRQEKDEGIE
jgi:hypothetical protein